MSAASASVSATPATKRRHCQAIKTKDIEIAEKVSNAIDIFEKLKLKSQTILNYQRNVLPVLTVKSTVEDIVVWMAKTYYRMYNNKYEFSEFTNYREYLIEHAALHINSK